jgi:hypothetical protein
MDNDQISSDVVSERFSARELAVLGLPGYPTTERGWVRLVEREAWKFRLVRGRGGKGGMRREYQPPAPVLELIHARQRGEIGPADEHGAIVGRTRNGAPLYLAEKQREFDDAKQGFVAELRRNGSKFGRAYVNVNILTAILELVDKQCLERSLLWRLSTAISAYHFLGNASKTPLIDVDAVKKITPEAIQAAVDLAVWSHNDEGGKDPILSIGSFAVNPELLNIDQDD